MSAEKGKAVEKTRVVNVKKAFGQKYDVYIGRQNHWTGHKQSVWANPFPVKEYGLDKALEKYEAYIRAKMQREPDLYAELYLMKGQVLGCWCRPERCHGDVLVKLIAEFWPD